MARKHLPHDPVFWRAIANEVRAEEVLLGMTTIRAGLSPPRVFIVACQVVGERRKLKTLVVRLRCLDAEKHARAVRRMAQRANRGLKPN